MNNFNHIIINKNRGWRGLAEVVVRDEKYKPQLSMIFSFSQAMWDDLIVRNRIVVQDNDFYYVINFHDDGKLPRPTQQRSVLIKDFIAKIEKVNRYEKSSWTKAEPSDWNAITRFIKNKNNHTTSDWNCIRHKSNAYNIVGYAQKQMFEKEE